MNPGTMVQLNRDIDNYSDILAGSGHIGIVASVDDESIWIKMFHYFPELDEWDNHLQVWREWDEDAITVLAPTLEG